MNSASPQKEPRSLLEVVNLTVTFNARDADVRAVRGISYAMNEAETVGMVGESGSGKSAGVLAMLGLAPSAIVTGSARFKEEELIPPRDKTRSRVLGLEIGVVFQDPLSSLDPTMTIGRQTGEALRRHHGLTYRASLERSAEMLSKVGIPDPRQRLSSYPHEFSGGMRQRVMIAAALINTPALLIADEPTTALDATVQAQILELLQHLRDEMGMALLIISHDLGVVSQISDRTIVMYAGRVLESAPTRELVSHPVHPYTEGLLNAVPRLDGDEAAQELIGIPGAPPSPSEPDRGCAFAPRCPYSEDVCLTKVPPLVRIAHRHSHACVVRTSERVE